MRNRNLVQLMAVLSLLAASCGGSSGTDDAGTSTTSPTTSTTTVTTTTSAAPATTAPPPAETTTTIPAGPLTLKDARGAKSGAGSLIVPGTYRSASPRVSVEFEISTEISVVLTPVIIAFGPPDFDPFSDPTLTVSALMGVATDETLDTVTHSPSPPVMPITGSQDLTEFLGNTPGIVLLDSGTADAVPWWDFTTAADSGGFSCPWGSHCRNIVAADGHGYFIIGEDWTVRLWRFESGSEPVYAWLQAPNDDFGAGLEWAQVIVDGMTVE